MRDHALVMLVGKWVWVWNWRRCEGGDVQRVAARLRTAGCAGALVKAFDGPRWFDQGRAWREIAAELKTNGVTVGGWGYCYGNDPVGEAQRAIETAQYGQADLLVLDVEAEYKGRPQAAEELCRRIRDALGPDFPLYFSSFAIARYHRSFPFEIFHRHCTGAVPQVYWNAFRWPVEQSLGWMYEDHAALGIPPERIFPAGGLYREGTVRYPPAGEVREFVQLAAARGSRGVGFWSYEHMNEEMWQAVASTNIGAPKEEEGMSSAEFDQLNVSVSQLAGRVGHLEAEVAAIRGSAPVAAPPRMYTVQSGDTPSGIAAAFGLDGWQRLYEINRGTIGGDPNRIYPGQVLAIP
jgi:LysM domain